MARIKYYNTTTQEWEYADGLSSGGIPEAPIDGKQYARQDGEWTEVQSASGDAKAIGRACYNLLAKAVYTEDVTALMSALWALVGANLVSISAVFTQGATVVYPTTALDSLKSMLVVTATYDDSTTAEINDYTLSGTLAEGTSTITVTYQSKTATFTVNVSAEPIVPTLDYISAVYTQGGTVYPSTALDDLKADLVVTAHMTDASTYTVDSADYTLSGTLAVGTSVVTVSYEDETTTFNVTVSETPSVTSYALHNTGGTDARFAIGKNTVDFDKIEITIDIPSFADTKILFNKESGGINPWAGVQNGAYHGMIVDKTVAEFVGVGKVTAEIVLDSSFGSSTSVLTSSSTNSFNPEYTLYEIKLYLGNTVVHDWKPTANVGEMFDSITQTTSNFTTTNGLTVSEVTV